MTRCRLRICAAISISLPRAGGGRVHDLGDAVLVQPPGQGREDDRVGAGEVNGDVTVAQVLDTDEVARGQRVIAAHRDAALVPRDHPEFDTGVGGGQVDQPQVETPGHELRRHLDRGPGDAERRSGATVSSATAFSNASRKSDGA